MLFADTLTLYSDRQTTGRRSRGVPQLSCVKGDACNYIHIDVIQCVNRGFDGHDVQWECKADLEDLYKLGRVEVTCEGYDYPDDPYVLVGSCGLEYSLYLTSKGQRECT